MEADLAVGVAPDETHRQSAPELTAGGLVANAAVQTRAEHVQLGLAHGSLEPEQEPVIEQARMIEAVGIADQRVAETGEIDEAVPVGIVAGEARCLEAEHEADMAERHLGGETGKPRASDRAGTGEPEILVDDDDAIIRPAEVAGLGREGVLPVRRLAIVLDLGGAGLAQIDNGLTGEMAGSDLGVVSHDSPPSPARPRASGR